MPIYPCHHHACTEHVARRGDVCAEHAGTRTSRQELQHRYDLHNRDREAKAFYNSAAWQRARATKLAHFPWCERCTRVWAEHVHHIIPLRQCSIADRTAQSNLMSLCPGCHTIIESEARQ